MKRKRKQVQNKGVGGDVDHLDVERGGEEVDESSGPLVGVLQARRGVDADQQQSA